MNKTSSTPVGNYIQCQLCKISAAEFDSWLSSRSTEDLLEGVAAKICERYVIQDQTVCNGAVHEMGDIIVDALTQSVFSPDYFCGEFLGYCTDIHYYSFYSEDWVKQLLETKPDLIKDNNYLNKIYD